MSSRSEEDDLIRIGELPPERVPLTRIGEIPQLDDDARNARERSDLAASATLDDEPFPNLMPPEGKSPAEAEAELPSELVRSYVILDRLEERLKAKPPVEEPTFRFTMSEAYALMTAMAIGLALGRAFVSGTLAVLIGGCVATLALARALLFNDASRWWVLIALSALMLYIGATIGAAVMTFGTD